MNDFEKTIRVLERHISAIHARSVLTHAIGEHRLGTSDFKFVHLNKINSALARGLRLFLSEQVTDRALQEVVALNKNRPARIEPCSIEIEAEADISGAR